MLGRSIYEMATAIELGPELCTVVVIMPPQETARLAEMLLQIGATHSHDESQIGLMQIFNALSSTRIQDAEASVASDLDSILRLIKQGMGYQQVNTAVVIYLQRWFAQTAESLVRQNLASGLGSAHLVQLLTVVGVLLRESGLFDEGIALVKHCLPAIESDTVDEATALRTLASFYLRRSRGDDMQEAQRLYVRCSLLFSSHQSGYNDSVEHANMLNAQGVVARKMGDHATAMSLFTQAKAFYDQRPDLVNRSKVMVIGNVGRTMALLGDGGGAMAAYEEALQILKSLDIWVNPDTGTLRVCVFLFAIRVLFAHW